MTSKIYTRSETETALALYDVILTGLIGGDNCPSNLKAFASEIQELEGILGIRAFCIDHAHDVEQVWMLFDEELRDIITWDFDYCEWVILAYADEFARLGTIDFTITCGALFDEVTRRYMNSDAVRELLGPRR